MLFLIYALTMLFFVPIYRVAKSKGLPARAIVIGVIAYTVTLNGIVAVASVGEIEHWLMDVAWVPVSLVLLAVQLLPARPEAPGPAWFTVHTACPECGATHVFDRSREDLMETCKMCGEIFRVPRERDASAAQPTGASPERRQHSEQTAEQHAEPDNWVFVAGYDSQASAEMNRVRLEEAGIVARLRYRAPGALHPTSLGCDVVVRTQDVERADRVLEADLVREDAP